jgi:hypothetical protein
MTGAHCPTSAEADEVIRMALMFDVRVQTVAVGAILVPIQPRSKSSAAPSEAPRVDAINWTMVLAIRKYRLRQPSWSIPRPNTFVQLIGVRMFRPMPHASRLEWRMHNVEPRPAAGGVGKQPHDYLHEEFVCSGAQG